MAESDRVRIGFVGVGGMGQGAHLRNYHVIPECEVVALAEVREATGKLVAERYGIPKAYANHEEMLANEKLDAIVASQPYTRHGILLPELVKAGKPIFIEKPLSSSLEWGEKVLQSVEGSDAWLMVGYHKRSDPASMFAKEEVDRLKASGELGKLKYIRIIMPAGDWVANGFLNLLNAGDAPNCALDVEPAPSDMDQKTYEEYSAFVNYYIHQVNLLRYFLGESYRVTFADPSGVLLVGESDSGLCCTIEMSPYVTSIDWQEQAFIAFERGYVKVNLPAPLASNRPGTVEILRDPGEGAVPVTEQPQMPWEHAMMRQAKNFIAAVKGERAPMTDAAEALEDLRVARQYIDLMKA